MPWLAVEAVKRVDTTVGFLTICVWVLIGGTAAGAWWARLPWQVPVTAFIAFLGYGFLRAVYQEYSVVENERDTLKEERETKEKRAAIATELQEVYRRGLNLRTGVMSSDDESPASEWQEELAAWRQDVFGYLHANVSVGKAEYVDAVTSVNAVTRFGMKSNVTRREKETIVSHLEERLNRLAEVMREY